ncbi:hypothetical protein VNI00_004971 [Paramarasmius palmivorus]|uniref:Heterokaryon incompatibility domain-containing protein n=1 Tax=Paramarasmius palmivorus TaxID=297713 RepID=A0AAW0DII3_9AGAR
MNVKNHTYNTNGQIDAWVPAQANPRSLVCSTCWTNLFTPKTFQAAWKSQFQQDERYFYEAYTTTLFQTKISAGQGCTWCILLAAGLAQQQDPPEDTQQIKIHVRFYRALFSSGSLVGGQSMAVRVGRTQWLNNMHRYIYADADDPCSSEVHARNLITNLRSPETYRLVHENVSECAKNHGQCTKPHEGNLPSRVISCIDPEHPKLIETKRQLGSYVVLSYVWGESQPHQSTTSNLQTYIHQGIPIDSVPQTIRDAIWITHACGHQYLWVDSFCIVQDSREDKLREISQIPHIFSNAYFTIIAARSPRVGAGFLEDYVSASSPDVFLPFVCQDGSIATMRASVPIAYDASKEPVNQRAWCLEEYLLSTRSLIYAGNTLQFSCKTTRMNVGKGVRRNYADEQSRMAYSMQVWFRLSDPGLDDWERSLVWHGVVEDYTSRSVTKYKDKLIALAGVAHQFRDVCSWTEYLAGLWKETLFYDLLWFRLLSDRSEKLVKYRGPSWSWASVEGSVEFSRTPGNRKLKPFDVVSKLGEHEMRLASNILLFGAVTEGSYIMIQARLVKAHIQQGSLLQFDTWDLYAHGYYPDTTEEIGGDVWFIPLVSRNRTNYHWFHAAGLVVVVADKSKSNCFRRVGYYFQDIHDMSWMIDVDEQVITLV